MRIIDSYNNCPTEAKGSVIALGNFDGVHLGHQKIISETIRYAKKFSAPSAVMTFEPHPNTFFKPDLDPFRITPFKDKAEFLDSLGIDFLFSVDFNKRFSEITAEQFVTEILVKHLAVKKVVIGHDFIFGHKRQGNIAFLTEKSKTYGFDVLQISAVQEKQNRTYSSTKIRDFLRNGEIDKANQWLGRKYAISGIIAKGDQRGRELGYPTANIYLEDHLRPKFGVYQVVISILGTKFNQLPAIASLGCKPMFEDNRHVLEVHVFDFNEDIYDKEVKIEFLNFIRAEKKFATVDELIAAIKQDCDIVRDLFN